MNLQVGSIFSPRAIFLVFVHALGDLFWILETAMSGDRTMFAILFLWFARIDDIPSGALPSAMLSACSSKLRCVSRVANFAVVTAIKERHRKVLATGEAGQRTSTIETEDSIRIADP
jgi:hypothetical protein